MILLLPGRQTPEGRHPARCRDLFDHCRQFGHAVATVNRRLAAMRTFYHFLQTESDDASSNPVFPHCHVIRRGSRLPNS